MISQARSILIGVLGILTHAVGASIECGPLETDKLTASHGAAEDAFGHSVCLDGDTAIIGMPQADHAGTSAGSALIFTRKSDGTWMEASTLIATDAEAYDYFGDTVSLDGDVALIGAPFDDDGGTNAGSAYVFTRQADGTWVETAKLSAGDAAGYKFFGEHVCLHADLAVVGCPYDNEVAPAAGSAYVFARQMGGSWLQVAKLLPNDGDAGDWFGLSGAVHNDVVMIGAAHDDGVGLESGSVYVFSEQLDGSWAQTGKLVAEDQWTADQFGWSVSLNGEFAIIGAPFDDDAGMNSGSVYIFTLQEGGMWAQASKHTASDGDAYDQFGISVSIQSGAAVVGAHLDNDGGTDVGSAYVLTQEEAHGGWLETSKLVNVDAAEHDYFGMSVSIDQNRVIVGVPRDDDEGPQSGSAWVFTCENTDDNPCPGDFDGDGFITVEDLLVVISGWGAPAGDVNGDGTTDIEDLLSLIGGFGPCP